MSKTFFPLIKKEFGEVTYEHIYIEDFPKGVIIAAAEKNFYVDQNHENNICAYYNKRILGKYEFIPEFSFFITDGRLCLDLLHNMGTFSESAKVLKSYPSLESAKRSKYYKYFCQMKQEIEKEVKERSKEIEENKDSKFRWGTMKVGTHPDGNGGEYEWECAATKEYVQLTVDLNENKWILTTSEDEILEKKYFFKNFEEFDKKELHWLKYHDELDVQNLDEVHPYYPIVKLAKEELGLIGGIVPDPINANDIEYMNFKFLNSSFELSMQNKDSRWYEEHTKIVLDGTITKKILRSKGKKTNQITKKTLSPELVKKPFSEVANFLSAGRLKENIFYDDSRGTLEIHFKNGDVKKFDRGLSRKDFYLMDFIQELL